jgi:poly-gamma-glutamate synthesis protein (capsule biosynthesis protein)
MHKNIKITKFGLGKKLPQKKYLLIILVCFIFTFLFFTLGDLFPEHKKLFDERVPSPNFFRKFTSPEASEISLKLLFVGDIFFDRHIDEMSSKSELKYAYPFSGLKSLNKGEYDSWIGNLECPVTEKQSTNYEKENYLKFSCKKGYLPEFKKYFDIVSLANNHTDNMDGRKGLEETRKHLSEADIKYFGDYDNSMHEKICEVFPVNDKTINNAIPIAFCGYHGVYKLPKEEDIKVIKKYSKHFITFVMPHQGEEYKFKSNTYQKRIYRSFIDNGADAVIGSHPHVIQETESYKGKRIFYSLGNFIFDQYWQKTREHMAIDVNVLIKGYKNNYRDLDCKGISSVECLSLAEELKVEKPYFDLVYTPIFTEAGKDYITKKTDTTPSDYERKLKSIGFTN